MPQTSMSQIKSVESSDPDVTCFADLLQNSSCQSNQEKSMESTDPVKPEDSLPFEASLELLRRFCHFYNTRDDQIISLFASAQTPFTLIHNAAVGTASPQEQ